jgi:putative tricarboxylic transport membrane protein
MHDHKDLVYAVILSNLAQAIILFFVGLAFVFGAVHVVKVPMRILAPMVLSLSIIGSYLITSSLVGPITLCVFSIFGWLLHRFDYPVAATVVGLLLARLTEGAFLRTYQMSGGHLSFLLERPIAMGLLALLAISFLVPVLRNTGNAASLNH